MPQRTEEQIGDIPVPPFVEETVEVEQGIPLEHLHKRTVVPLIQEHFLKNVQVIHRKLFPEHFDEREIPDAVSSLRGAAHAAPAPVNEYLASIEHVSSSSSAARSAPTSTDGIIEQLTNMCELIEKRTEEIAMLAKRCAEGPPAKSHQPDGL